MSIRRILFWVVVAVIMYIASCGVYAADGDQMKVHMINVGNGDAALIEYNGHYALIDGGFATHAGQYKDDKAVAGTCRLDKTGSISDALDGKIDNLASFYGNNLFSFFEHFDNDLMELTEQNGAASIMDSASAYIDAFDESELTEDEISLYETHRDAFEAIRSRLGGTYKKEPEILQSFMELQNEDLIKAEPKDSMLFKYYTALGYEYIYQQAHQYMRGDGGLYVKNNYNDCLTYLKKMGVTDLDYMILSHAHKDHVGGLSAILADDTIHVQRIIYNGTSYGSGNFRIFEREMMDREADGTEVIVADDEKNNQFLLGDKVMFTQLGDTERLPAYTREPDQTDEADKDRMNHIVNNQSLVFRVDVGGESMLFTGDAEGQKDAEGNNRQLEILSGHKALLNVDVYKAAHHCHNNASNVNFNDAMSPYFVLTSCGTSKEPHKTARAALAGADMWLTKGNGDAIVATIAPSRFTVNNGNGKNITESPKYTHTLDYTVGASFGTPNSTKAAFAAGGKTVDALRYTTTAVRYYNPPAGSIRLTAKAGWYYDTIQRQKSAGDKGVSSSDWQKGGVTSLNGDFRGTVYYRFSNKYGKSFVRKTDGFETRGNRSSIRKGRIALAGYNSATLDWYPVKGVSKYKVWFKKGKKWKSAGTTRQLYLTARKLPAGKKVQLRVQGVGKKGYAYAYIRTLKKMAAPKVKSRGGKARVSWKKLTGAAGYQVAVNAKVLSTVKGSRSATISVTKGKKLKYKVRAYTVSNGKTIYGPWSKVKKYKI